MDISPNYSPTIFGFGNAIASLGNYFNTLLINHFIEGSVSNIFDYQRSIKSVDLTSPQTMAIDSDLFHLFSCLVRPGDLGAMASDISDPCWNSGVWLYIFRLLCRFRGRNME